MRFIFTLLTISITALVLLSPQDALSQAVDKVADDMKVSKSLVKDIDFSKNELTADAIFGLSNITGNTRSLTLNGSGTSVYRVKRFENQWNFGAYYNRLFSSTDNDKNLGTQTKYIYGTYRLDYYLNQKQSLFIGGGGYTDMAKDINVAGQGFTGIRFFIVRNPKTAFNLSFGYNFTYEDREPMDRNKKINSAMQEIYFSQKIGKTTSFVQKVEFLVDLKDGYDSRINSKTSLKVKISNHLGVSLGFTVKFDNEPGSGDRKTDTYTDAGLMLSY